MPAPPLSGEWEGENVKRLNIPPLNETIHTLEDSIITLSGPALAISGIIAGVDLVTGGNMLKSVGWLALAWAICLLLTLDFQVLALGARAHRVYLSKKDMWRKIIEIVLAILVAGAISFVSIQMQSIIARSNSVTPALSIDAATIQMGINPIALIWERSSLVLVLIFLSGWFREDDTEQGTVIPAIVPPAEVQQPDLEQVIERLDALYNKRMEVMIERVTEQVTVSIVQRTQPQLPAIAESTNEPTIVPAEGSKGAKVQAYLEQCKSTGHKPTLKEIMDRTACAKGTAIRYRTQFYGQEDM